MYTNAVGHFDEAIMAATFVRPTFPPMLLMRGNSICAVVAAICVFLCPFSYSFLLPRYLLCTGGDQIVGSRALALAKCFIARRFFLRFNNMSTETLIKTNVCYGILCSDY